MWIPPNSGCSKKNLASAFYAESALKLPCFNKVTYCTYMSYVPWTRRLAKSQAVPGLPYLESSRQAVYDVKEKLELTGSADRTAGSYRKTSVRVKSVINKVKEKIQTDALRSTRGMAADLKISSISLRRTVKNRLQMKSRARVKVLLLTQQQKETRPKRVKATLNDLPEEMWPPQSPDLNPLDYSV